MKIKIDKVMAAKIVGAALTFGGMLINSWTSKQDQDKTLTKLVEEKNLQSKMGEQ